MSLQGHGKRTRTSARFAENASEEKLSVTRRRSERRGSGAGVSMTRRDLQSNRSKLSPRPTRRCSPIVAEQVRSASALARDPIFSGREKAARTHHTTAIRRAKNDLQINSENDAPLIQHVMIAHLTTQALLCSAEELEDQHVSVHTELEQDYRC